MEVLPVLDLNTLESNEECIKLEKDIVNLSSVQIADQIIATLLSGSVNPLEFAVKRKLVIDAFELVMKHHDIKSLLINEIEKYGKQGASALGAKVYITTRASYEYDKDPTWMHIKTNIKPFEDALKSQEERIKAACKNGGSIMDENGIIIACAVPSPKSESIAVSFSKK